MGHDYDDHGWGMDAGMGWGGWLMMSVVLITFLVLVAALVYTLVRGSTTAGVERSLDGGPGRGPGAAERTLDERLARGEIDVADYQQRKTALRGG
jgi:putative membrane protein